MSPPKSALSPLRPIATALARDLDRLSFAYPVAYVYNPLAYAWDAHAEYLDRFGQGAREIVLLGMNPGPFGMAQCGVPFGDVAMVRDFLGIETKVGKPAIEHPKRPVLGFESTRAEVSGTRFWGWAKARYGTPERFFEKLPLAERAPVLARCDEALRQTVAALSPRLVIGVGNFARDAARRALEGRGVDVGCMLHPSPASPRANRDWAAAAEADLAQAGVTLR